MDLSCWKMAGSPFLKPMHVFQSGMWKVMQCALWGGMASRKPVVMGGTGMVSTGRITGAWGPSLSGRGEEEGPSLSGRGKEEPWS